MNNEEKLAALRLLAKAGDDINLSDEQVLEAVTPEVRKELGISHVMQIPSLTEVLEFKMRQAGDVFCDSSVRFMYHWRYGTGTKPEPLNLSKEEMEKGKIKADARFTPFQEQKLKEVAAEIVQQMKPQPSRLRRMLMPDSMSEFDPIEPGVTPAVKMIPTGLSPIERLRKLNSLPKGAPANFTLSKMLGSSFLPNQPGVFTALQFIIGKPKPKIGSNLVWDTELPFASYGVGSKALKKFIAKNIALRKKAKKTYLSKKQLSKQLDKRYSAGYQNHSAKPSYFSKSLEKKHGRLSVTNYQKDDYLNLGFTAALLFKNRVNAARRRKAKQRRK